MPDFTAFARQAGRLMDQAAWADLPVLPELCTLALFTTFADWQRKSLRQLGKVDTFTAACREFLAAEVRCRKLHIPAGSHLEREGNVLLNRAYLFGPAGLVQTHAKTHLFPAKTVWGTAGSDSMQAVDLPFARVGINIWDEAEMPECAASLAGQDAEIVRCPSFTFGEHGFRRVRHCADSHCLENRLYFVYCATGGRLPKKALPNGWTRGSILSPCDAPWTSPRAGLAEGCTNPQRVEPGAVDLNALHRHPAKGAAPPYRDRRRHAARHDGRPSPLPSQSGRV